MRYYLVIFPTHFQVETRNHVVSVLTRGPYKDAFRVLWNVCADERTERPSLSTSFYHSNRRLLIEVEEDNDHIYSSPHLLFHSFSLSLSVSPPLSSSFPTLSPSIRPHSQGESIR